MPSTPSPPSSRSALQPPHRKTKRRRVEIVQYAEVVPASLTPGTQTVGMDTVRKLAEMRKKVAETVKDQSAPQTVPTDPPLALALAGNPALDQFGLPLDVNQQPFLDASGINFEPNAGFLGSDSMMNQMNMPMVQPPVQPELVTNEANTNFFGAPAGNALGAQAVNQNFPINKDDLNLFLSADLWQNGNGNGAVAQNGQWIGANATFPSDARGSGAPQHLPTDISSLGGPDKKRKR